MGELIRQHGVDTDQKHAAYFAARERRRSLAGVVDLFRTHRFLNVARLLTVIGATAATPIVITTLEDHGLVTGMTVSVIAVIGVPEANTSATVTVLTSTTFEMDGTSGTGSYSFGGVVEVPNDMPVPSITTGDVFPVRSGLTTFRTAVRIGAGSPLGLVFEFGSSTRGCGVAINGATIILTAGGLTTEVATATFDNGSVLPEGLELELVCALRPGDGRVRLWGNGQEIARATASSDSFGGDWADANAGSFAQSAAGTCPAALTAANSDPANFEVIEPLSVYIGSVPQHFV